MKIRLLCERDAIAARVCLRAHRGRALGRVPSDVRADSADIVAPERALDRVEVRQRSTARARAMRRRGVDVAIADRLGRLDLLRQRALARPWRGTTDRALQHRRA